MKKKTTIYLDDVDRKAIAAIKQHYHLDGDSQAIRLALALTAMEANQKGQSNVSSSTSHPKGM